MGGKYKPRKIDSELRGREVQIMIKLRRENLRTSNLVDLVGISQANTSRALGFLRLKKFVKSVQDSNNGVIWYHSLTGAGREYLNSLI